MPSRGECRAKGVRLPNIASSDALAANAPISWAAIYGPTSLPRRRRDNQNPIVTAGLRCAARYVAQRIDHRHHNQAKCDSYSDMRDGMRESSMTIAPVPANTSATSRSLRRRIFSFAGLFRFRIPLAHCCIDLIAHRA